jgi:CO/xanthine dehydrogenase FAD-binding subunit
MSEPLYVRAESIEHAAAALKSAGGDGLVVAGGIVVGSLINQRLASPNVLVDISRIGPLRRIERKADGGIMIGALVTHDDILRSPEIKRAAPVLAAIAEEISCPRLRNRGTIGGSLCTVSGQGDPATGLIALEAQLHLRSTGGSRSLPLERFYKDAFHTELADDEILEWIDVPPKSHARFGFFKLGPRAAMDWTQITAAVGFVPDSDRVTELRIGMNGVANTPMRLRAAERSIGASKIDDIDWKVVSDALNAEISPSGDLIYSEQFKRHLAMVALQRAFERAVEQKHTG